MGKENFIDDFLHDPDSGGLMWNASTASAEINQKTIMPKVFKTLEMKKRFVYTE